MLPDGCCWESHHLTPTTAWLYVGHDAVALVGQRIDGRWHTTVNRHLEPKRWRTAYCSRQDIGMRWVEKWAAAQIDRLRAEQSPPVRLGVTKDRD